MIDCFDFTPGTIVANKYQVISHLGRGWEGEVYLTKELATGIERAAKFFFPKRNKNNEVAKRYAQKLHKVRYSPIIIQYHNQEIFEYDGTRITCLISDFVEGELLSDYILRQPGKRLHSFQALHILHSLAAGLEEIHLQGEYHGDLHTGNIFIRPVGIGYSVKLIDLYDWRDSKRENMMKDVCDLIRIFYDMIGGRAVYSKQTQEIKSISCGLKTSIITKKFRNASFLKRHIETIPWSQPKRH